MFYTSSWWWPHGVETCNWINHYFIKLCYDLFTAYLAKLQYSQSDCWCVKNPVAHHFSWSLATSLVLWLNPDTYVICCTSRVFKYSLHVYIYIYIFVMPPRMVRPHYYRGQHWAGIYYKISLNIKHNFPTTNRCHQTISLLLRMVSLTSGDSEIGIKDNITQSQKCSSSK